MAKDNVVQLPDGVRKDLWWITDAVLNASFMIVAQQFIHDDEYQPESREAFAERATYILRQLCPITYSYFFQQAKVETLPYGAVEVLLEMIRAQRPLFLGGAENGTV